MQFDVLGIAQDWLRRRIGLEINTRRGIGLCCDGCLDCGGEWRWVNELGFVWMMVDDVWWTCDDVMRWLYRLMDVI